MKNALLRSKIKDKEVERILMFHIAAIGDAVLATPVSARLKQGFPQASIAYLTHGALIPLLELCPSIDNFHTYDRGQSIISVRQQISRLQPDLIVDLSGSQKSFLMTAFLAPHVFRYRKQGEKSVLVLHAVDNFIKTIDQLHLPAPEKFFPTLNPPPQLLESVRAKLPLPGGACLAVVPGVGLHRPHRAWPIENWIELCTRVFASTGTRIILVGGTEETELCRRIVEATGNRCINAAGMLTLPETAALLQLCAGTVSGDTGPAHISVAVGTPVVSIYGPTLPQRSAPYGMADKLIDASARCRCIGAKFCTISGEGRSGYCLANVTVEEVYSLVAKSFSL